LEENGTEYEYPGGPSVEGVACFCLLVGWGGLSRSASSSVGGTWPRRKASTSALGA